MLETKLKARRFTPEQRAQVLADAEKHDFTGREVAAKYGITVLTYYTWRRTSGVKWHAIGKRGARGEGSVGRSVLDHTAKRALRRLIADIVRAELEDTW